MGDSQPAPRSPTGVGLGLRWEFLDELLDRLDADSDSSRNGPASLAEVAFWEIAPENYMRRGGYIPESLDRVAARFPMVTHGLQMSVGGTDPFPEAYFEQVRALLERVRSPWHSDHLCFCGTDGRILHDLLPMPQTDAAVRHVADRARWARDRLGVPLALENISFYLQLGEHEMPEAEFVARVVDAADCALLLDVNNVYVNSLNHGFDPRAWIEHLDLDRVVQIHVAGHEHRPDDGLVIDTHGADVVDPVVELLAWTIARVGPVAVLLERDNDVPPLDDLLAERARLDVAYRAGLEAYEERTRRSA